MKNLWTSITVGALFLVFAGIAFPASIYWLGQLLFPFQANGSLLTGEGGRSVGSALIGQSFTRPEYFHPRASSAGSGHDASNSSGSNLGPTSTKLIHGTTDDLTTFERDESFNGLQQLAEKYRRENGLDPKVLIPADAATRSASGLDPDISPSNARLQIARVAKARDISPSRIENLLAAHTDARFLGIFGEPRVNVLRLNLALDRTFP